MKMKNILVLVQNYPNNNGGVALMYVHVRNKYYSQHNINVTVLNFSSEENYVIDGINVITEKTYIQQQKKYDIVVSHAANIRNHYRFLVKNAKDFSRMIFFFHGHEVLKINKVYPKPYDYMKKNSFIKMYAQDIYDNFKLAVWHSYFKKIAYKTDFIFVSNCLYNEFKTFTKLSEDDLHGNVHIINNSVGKVFEDNSYRSDGDKKYDFITIRNNMDSSTYCIDLVCKLAENNPNFSFLIIGKGTFFKNRCKPNNITWIDKYLKHEDILNYVNHARCALMPTRRDTQGVMSCELVTYGIPLITSDLPVCREIFGKIPTVAFMNNDIRNENLSQLYLNLLKKSRTEIDMFGYSNTVKREENIIKMEY